MPGPILIPLWAVVLGPPAFVTLMILDKLTGGRSTQVLDDIHARQIDRQFGWSHRNLDREIEDMHKPKEATMANGVPCSKCGWTETAHEFPKHYPATRRHKYVPQKSSRKRKKSR
jgi:hypothetical protein